MQVKIQFLEHGKGLPKPSYATSDSAGADLMAAIIDNVTIHPRETKLIPCGFNIEIPHGYEGQVRSRSGMSLNHGVVVLNSPGTIDSDYRGEIKLILMNMSDKTFVVKRGMRLAQLVISSVEHAEFCVEEKLSESERLESGFGSTGI